MKILDHKQGSVDWAIARAGIPTASEFDQFIKPSTFELRDGRMVESYLAKKLAERWTGGPLAEFNSWDMEAGQILEEEARPYFELRTGLAVRQVGLCLTDDGRVGCSPDGLLEDGTGLEIKCPRIETHIRYLLRGELPLDYACQVHGSMWVTGASNWTFMSYRRQLPPLLLKIERDNEIQANLTESISRFLEMFDAKFNELAEKHGCLPFRKPQPKPQPTQETETLGEIIP